MMEVTITLKPHPACKGWGELIDIYSSDGGPIPWASVHIDAFHQNGTQSSDNELYQLLYAEKKTVKVRLEIIEVDGEAVR